MFSVRIKLLREKRLSRNCDIMCYFQHILRQVFIVAACVVFLFVKFLLFKKQNKKLIYQVFLCVCFISRKFSKHSDFYFLFFWIFFFWNTFKIDCCHSKKFDPDNKILFRKQLWMSKSRIMMIMMMHSFSNFQQDKLIIIISQ